MDKRQRENLAALEGDEIIKQLGLCFLLCFVHDMFFDLFSCLLVF